MSNSANISITRRPLNNGELADLQNRAATAEFAELEQQRRYWRSTTIRVLLAAVIYILLWAATFRLRLDLTKTVVSTVASLMVVVGAGVWDHCRSRGRVRQVRAYWLEVIHNAQQHPVEQIDFAPLRAWSSEQGYIFDLDHGRALFFEWDPPLQAPRSEVTWSRAAGGFVWTQQRGPLVPIAPLKLDWNRFPDEHPITGHWGPALFDLGVDDPAQALHNFANGSFPLEEVRS